MPLQIFLEVVDEADAAPRTVLEVMREIASGAAPCNHGARARIRKRLERALAARGIEVASQPSILA